MKKDPKDGLKELGEDIGKAIVYFACKEYVTFDIFNSDVEQKAYEKIVRDKIEEAYNKTLVELLRNIGITLKNALKVLLQISKFSFCLSFKIFL